MVSDVKCWTFESNSTFATDQIEFKFFEEKDRLPFPLNLSLPLKILITLCLCANQIFGTYFRAIIFAYLKAPETKLGPINKLIWIDQVNGIFFGISTTFVIALLVLPFNLNDMFGHSLCDWLILPGSFYISGSVVWSCFIAFYRNRLIGLHLNYF